MLRKLKSILKNINNRFKFKVNVISKSKKLSGLKIVSKGINNKVYIGNNCTLDNCKVVFFGNNNSIFLSDRTFFSSITFWFEDNNNEIRIGENSTFRDGGRLSCNEGTKIIVGSNCLFSYNVDLRTGDSHSIIDFDNLRINKSKDIEIKNHVWVCRNVSILKGTMINSNCVVGACSLLNKKYQTDNCIIAGNPAKVVKENINWDISRKITFKT